jgi:hypothetical protein
MNLACPHCGAAAELDGYDVLGAPSGAVWCNRCNQLSRGEDLLDVPEPDPTPTVEHLIIDWLEVRDEMA